MFEIVLGFIILSFIPLVGVCGLMNYKSEKKDYPWMHEENKEEP